MRGRDILAKARTGSGKTAAYSLPVLQKILDTQQAEGKTTIGLRAVLLMPTRELVHQTSQHLRSMLSSSAGCISHLALVGPKDASQAAQRARIKEGVHVIVGTPSQVAHQVKDGVIDLSCVDSFVIDEADLVLSYGYRKDVETVVSQLPSTCQNFLMSATLGDDVQSLKQLILHNPAVLKLELEEAEQEDKIRQFAVPCPETDKYLLLYVLLRLKLLHGKALIFVNDIDRGFKVRLFLERMSLRAALLNSELPLNSRLHILEQFNRGAFQYLIATDAEVLHGLDKHADVLQRRAEERLQQLAAQEADDVDDDEEEVSVKEEEDSVADDSVGTLEGDDGDGKGDVDGDDVEAMQGQGVDETQDEGKQRSSKKPSSRAEEFGVSRGYDFKGVENVINFDFPSDASNYVHRIGRTARGGASGTAMSFIGKRDYEVLQQTVDLLKEEGRDAISPYEFQTSLVEGFRYRVDDVLFSITANTVRDARAEDVKREILNSKKLQAHFEDNPQDLAILQHTRRTHDDKRFQHLARIPQYLLPKTGAIRRALKQKDAQQKRGHKRGGPGGDAKGDNRKRKAQRGADPLKAVGNAAANDRLTDSLLNTFSAISSKRKAKAGGKKHRSSRRGKKGRGRGGRK